MPTEKKEGKAAKPPELENSDYEALSALLDFHSDRAVAHASFLVACVFGLFTVLSLIGRVDSNLKWIYSITYWILWSAGLYSLLNFRFFATKAQDIMWFIIENKESLLKRFKEETRKQPEKKSTLWKKFTQIKESKKRFPIMLVMYIFFIGLLPWLSATSLISINSSRDLILSGLIFAILFLVLVFPHFCVRAISIAGRFFVIIFFFIVFPIFYYECARHSNCAY